LEAFVKLSFDYSLIKAAVQVDSFSLSYSTSKYWEYLVFKYSNGSVFALRGNPLTELVQTSRKLHLKPNPVVTTADIGDDWIIRLKGYIRNITKFVDYRYESCNTADGAFHSLLYPPTVQESRIDIYLNCSTNKKRKREDIVEVIGYTECISKFKKCENPIFNY
jgi:hypothetical protein